MKSSLAHTRLFAFTIALLVAVSATGCATTADFSTQSNNAGPELPRLGAPEEVRDQIARSEYAIVSAATEMAELATTCSDCVGLFEVATASANERLTLAGGMWEPWPEASAEVLADLPEPVPVGEAPRSPGALVGYMSRTANEQLLSLADTDKISGEEATVLASVLLGRQVSAQRIAQFYGVSVPEAASSLPASATATSANQTESVHPEQAEKDSVIDPEDTVQSEEATRVRWAGNETAETALTSYDCVASSLGFTDLALVNPEVEQKLFDALLFRNADFVAGEVPDNRGIRCVLQTTSIDELFDVLISADLELFANTTSLDRLDATRFLQEDFSYWLAVGNPSEVHPGITKAEPVENVAPQS